MALLAVTQCLDHIPLRRSYRDIPRCPDSYDLGKCQLSMIYSIGWVQISAEGNQSSVRHWGLPLRVQLLLLYKQEPCASIHDPQPWPSPDRFLYITIKSWALSGNPQRYTEPPWPSAELCTIPWLMPYFRPCSLLPWVSRAILPAPWLPLTGVQKCLLWDRTMI